MTPAIAIKTVCAHLLRTTGVLSRLVNRNSETAAIMMYHRVISAEKAESYLQAGMHVDPSTFDMHIRYLCQNFEVVPLAEVASFLRDGHPGPRKRPLCAITFDDGWLDFYQHAFPVLQNYSAPATVFLPTGFMGTRKCFWTDRLACLMHGKDTLSSRAPRQGALNPLVDTLLDLKGPKESQTESAIGMMKSHKIEVIEQVLCEFSSLFDVAAFPDDRAFLSWDEVRELYRSGLVAFGSHTVDHRILTTLSEPEIRVELIQSKERLLKEEAVDHSFIPFCYPNGNHDVKISRMVQEAGYDLAVTTNSGLNRSDALPYALKRVALHQDISATEGMLGCRIAGVF